MPDCSSAVRALRCIFTMFTPSTSTRPVLRKTRITLPSFPLSSPRITRTVSPLDTFSFIRSAFLAWRAMSRLPAVFLYFRTLTLYHLWGERHDLHVLLVAELARHGSEDTSRPRLACIVDDHNRVLVEANVGAVLAAGLLRRPHYHGSRDVRLLNGAVGERVLDGDDDDVAE